MKFEIENIETGKHINNTYSDNSPEIGEMLQVFDYTDEEAELYSVMVVDVMDNIVYVKEFDEDYPNSATLSEFECLNWEPGGGLGEDERFVVQSDLDVKLVDGEFVLLEHK